MNSKERIKAALIKNKVDRMPVTNLFDLKFLSSYLNIERAQIEEFVNNPVEKLIKFQEDINHDPMLFLYQQEVCAASRWYNSYIKWNEDSNNEWVKNEEVLKYEDGNPLIRNEYATPAGSMTATYRRDIFTDWVLEHPMKNEKELECLRYRPDPEYLNTSRLEELVKSLGDRVFILFGIQGVWQEACSLRGPENIIYDIFDRPDWVKELLKTLKEYTISFAKKLTKTGIDCIMLNESSVGLGISKAIYDEFIGPLDNEIISEINSAGVLTSFHICGKCNSLLESMADSGATCIEPLAPLEYAGDIELAGAKKRIGDKTSLWGGFKERVLKNDSEALKAEIKRCLEAAANGGGYVLRGTGVIYEAQIENLKNMSEIAAGILTTW